MVFSHPVKHGQRKKGLVSTQNHEPGMGLWQFLCGYMQTRFCSQETAYWKKKVLCWPFIKDLN